MILDRFKAMSTNVQAKREQAIGQYSSAIHEAKEFLNKAVETRNIVEEFDKEIHELQEIIKSLEAKPI